MDHSDHDTRPFIKKIRSLSTGICQGLCGDTLWALMVFWGIGFLFVKMSTGKVMAAALLLSYAIEFSQLYQADWINALRHTTLGGLVLGFGFLWSDLVCYTVGVLAGGLMEYTAAPFFFRSIVCLRRGKGRRE